MFNRRRHGYLRERSYQVASWHGWSQRAAELDYQQTIINTWKPWQQKTFRIACAKTPSFLKGCRLWRWIWFG
jgi:hypothetical protein